MKIIDFETSHKTVCSLIEQFEEGITHYLSPAYQEQEVRQDYIDKFFTALGWDVNHIYQKNPFQQEVKIEKAQRQQGGLGQKRADYAFFLSPDFKQEQFFVEAKKPVRALRQNKEDYFQTAKYGWNAGTGVSILTDFEEIVIIDCRFQPDFDTILQAQIKYYNYKDFKNVEIFEEFYWLFSKEAVVAGNLKSFIEGLKKPKNSTKQPKISGGKYQSIDESFLNYIDEKRYELAVAFYQNNPTLDAYSLTEATQRTIDRIVFMRFLEDKAIEHESIVQSIATSEDPWSKFVERSRFLDAKYNGIVFKPSFIDKKDFGGAEKTIFKELCSELDHTNTPYDFNYIPIHILGSIYERFLGKIVVIKDGEASIEVKPQVRKAGGVFYTPKYIVDYIVKNTIGKIIENKTPKQISSYTFADIACGSGSFLIGAFEYILDYHKKFYNDNFDQARKDGCNYSQDLGVYVLSIKQKQQILLNNIYGVDIDLQATEVTQLSLFLKMLEDETLTSASEMMVLFHEKILPNLSENIKCGNSLIGTDVLSNKLDFDLVQERRLNPFDFKYAFPKVFKNGGFNTIIGNPPYVTIGGKEDMTTTVEEIDYYRTNYLSSGYKPNLYTLFYEKAFKLIKEKGVVSYIVPRSLLDNKYHNDIRKFFVEKSNIQEIIKLNYEVFDSATTGGTTICFFQNSINPKNVVDLRVVTSEKDFPTISTIKMPQTKLLYGKYHIITTNDPTTLSLINRINKKSKELINFCSVNNGVNTGNASNFLLFYENSNDNYRKILEGKDVNRYSLTWKGLYINYDKNLKKTIDLSKLQTRQKKIDFALRDEKIFNSEKIIIRQTSDRIIACLDSDQYISRHSTHCIVNEFEKIDLRFLLAILNSKLINYVYQNVVGEKGKAFAEVKGINVKQLPIPIITKNTYDICEQIIQSVNQLLISKERFKIAVTDKDRSYLEERCRNLEAIIDSNIYILYNLSSEEIDIVENYGN